MAAKKPKRGRKAGKPERVIAPAVGTIGATKLNNIFEAGKLQIDKKKFKAFMDELKHKGITSPKVRFVARNAPFMRRAPILPV
jgi:hypothetical protein